jgi:photosystem II stability/assembly factor-like uncharacterized protein
MKKFLFRLLVPLAAWISVTALSCGDVTGPSQPEAWNGWAVGENHDGHPLILHTVDGGSTWTQQGTSESLPDVQLQAVRAVDSLVAWAGGDAVGGAATILRTTNAGESWEVMGVAGGLPDASIMSISALGTGDVWMSGTANTILHTTDGGETWQDLSDPAFANCWFEGIFALDAEHIWACGGTPGGEDGVIIHTSDGGVTWTAQGDSALLTGYPILSVSAWDAQHAWIVGHDYTFARTQDGGESWELCLPDSLHREGATFDANGVAPVSLTDVWTCLDLGQCYLTNDGGDNWTKQDLPGSASGYLLLRICAADLNHVWMTGIGQAGGVIVGRNGGTAWTIQTIPDNDGMHDISFAGTHH